tara:strand:- start:362 stop:874 length:513 start_codon:yes stop_codon:yes gene_type:complete
MKNKSLSEILGTLGDIDKEISKFNDGIESAKKGISDNINFRDLSKTISKLKDISKSTDTSPMEEYDYDTVEETTLDTIWDMIDDTPNNMELGKKIRQFYYEQQEATPDPLEKAANTMKDKPTYSYESPDGGNTVYKRAHGSDERVLVKDGEQLNIFEENPNQLNLFTDTE